MAKSISLFNRLSRSDCNTRLLETYGHDCSVAGYLARYDCGSPISGRRIERVTSDEVAFWYRNHRDGQQMLMRLTPNEFLTRWSEQVPPRGLPMIRHSGLYANGCAGVRTEICRQLNTRSPAETSAAKTAASAIRPLDSETCPVRGTLFKSSGVRVASPEPAASDRADLCPLPS